MASVNLQSIKKRYVDGTVAVHELDLDVRHGEFLTLLGPSGCGKSTVLRMIAGLEHPTSGDMSFDGNSVIGLPVQGRNVAMVFQNYALYPNLTVRRNLEYPLRKRSVPASERKKRVDEIAQLLRLEALLHRYPRQLSGGQQQRVALGRAIIREPAVFLLDEPLSNLDAALRSALRSEIVRLHRKSGTTMIYVTHDQHEAMTMSDRIVVMQEGRVQQIGSPDEIYRRPTNTFVGGFVGTPAMNFLPGRWLSGTAGKAVEVAGMRIDCEPFALSAGADNGPVVVGIRPEHLTIGEGPGNAQVVDIETTGADQFVTFRLFENEVVGRFDMRTKFDIGQDISLTAERNCTHLFDADSGARVF